jgi:hypothetical protein
MQNLFPVVALGVVVLSVLAMLVVLVVSDGGATGRSAYDQIGQGGFSRDSDASERASALALGSPSERAEQEREIRQMLSARSERLVRSGKPALDIDAELARLLQPQQRSHDAGLIEEVRQLVTARNERRARKGMQELDVDQEIQRTLQELDP